MAVHRHDRDRRAAYRMGRIQVKLGIGTIHLLRLAVKGADADGWAKVSQIVWPLCENLPDDLVEKRPAALGGGHIRLTRDGEVILRHS